MVAARAAGVRALPGVTIGHGLGDSGRAAAITDVDCLTEVKRGSDLN
ncbi:MAG: hypothetical protein ACRDRK_05285 [Pseudonocardia sp.]